ncbi:MAG: SDR family oxidoreductase [Chloroflexi bacterium]|nr:MAG: SDR family oxidoreductase [Chloroflexota bacterium]
MRAVIAGGAGFIGSHLSDVLLERGWEVVVIDSLLSGSMANVAHLAGSPRFTFVRQDVSRPVRIRGRVDSVLHLASPASPVDFFKYPIQILKASTLGTHNLLGLAKAKGARFLLASTSEVYGDPLVHPQPEDYWGNVNPIGPRGCYDEAKRCAEAFTMAYHRAHGLDTRIVRIFNTYGPRMRLDDGRMLPNFITQALRDEPITVYGDGTQTRSVTYVDDLVRGMLAVLESDDPLPFNIGDQNETSVIDLARRVRRMAHSSSAFAFRPLPEDDPKQRRPDTSRAQAILGWQPEIGLVEGLGRTFDYFSRALAS